MTFRPDYLAGFPWHPHRGIEAITYVLAGTVEPVTAWQSRLDRSGDVQWMTAGSGIIHQEMPRGDQAGRMHGFQLWANLPAALKIRRHAIRNRAADIPVVTDDDGTQVGLVCGTFWGKTVPWTASPPIPSISMCRAPGLRKTLPSKRRATRSPTYSRLGKFCNASGPLEVPTEPVSWGGHESSRGGRKPFASYSSIEAMKSWCRPAMTASAFYLSRGKPLQEPVAWYGPIVMNTQEQLRQAFGELEKGTFLKSAQKK